MNLANSLSRAGINIDMGGIVNSAKEAFDVKKLTNGLNIPNITVPEAVKGMDKLTPNFENNLKIPPEVQSYIDSAKSGLSTMGIPSSIGELQGLQIPQVPDIMPVISKAQGMLSSIGIDTSFVDVDKITSMISIKDDPLGLIKSLNLGIDIPEIPDMNAEMDKFKAEAGNYDTSALESEIEQITKEQGLNVDIDLSKLL